MPALQVIENPLGNLRRSLIENGYTPIPVKGKRPVISGWSSLKPDRDEVARLIHQYADHTNTGLLTGTLVAIDVDVPHAATAARIEELIRSLPGGEQALRRVGAAPKSLYVFRSSTAHDKTVTPVYVVDSLRCQIEVLGAGQQFVAFGRHPDTGRDYQWTTASPLEVAFGDLPEIDDEKMLAFLADAERVLSEAGSPLKPPVAKPAQISAGSSFWQKVNQAALEHADAWVRQLFHGATKEVGTGAWRVSSKELGRALQEDLSIHADGVRDFGLEQPETPISLVEKYGGAGSPKDAAFWLCAQIGRDPQELGWEVRDAGFSVNFDGLLKAPPVAANDNQPQFSIFDWPVSRFVGEAPSVEYLVDGVIPLGVPGMVSAMGDTGKSFAMLELHRRVSFGSSRLARPVFGGRVAVEGTSVMITSEDDAAEVHRRVAALDDRDYRSTAAAEKMIVVPLPSAGGARAFWHEDRKLGLRETDFFQRIADQLRSIRDLRLVTFDPLASFAHLPLNEDPAAGQFVCTSLSRLATETGATVLVAHHMRKTQKPIETLGDARDAIRGSTALVDGLRLAYAMWPADEARAKRICKELGEDFTANKVVLGGVVKANGAARRTIATMVRNQFGLLIDRTADLGAAAPAHGDLLNMMASAIEAAASGGQPFTKTGATGVYAMRDRLPGELKGLSRHRLEGLVGTLVERHEVQLCLASGTATKWLDVPGGQFAIGLGNFRKGAASA